MPTLNNQNIHGYRPQNQDGSVELTVSYEPAGYGPNVVGVHNPGVAPDVLVDVTQQKANDDCSNIPGVPNGPGTSPIGGLSSALEQSVGGIAATNAPDNFLPSTVVIEQNLNTPITNAVKTAGVTPQVNAAQLPSSGKSLSPGRG
jgi:hypothetical protein